MISKQSHTFSCNSRIIVHVTVKIALSFASCNFLTVTGTIILELHSNVILQEYYISTLPCIFYSLYLSHCSFYKIF